MVIEVTERNTVSVARVVIACNRLRGVGFRVALEDEGAGNSGLDVLRRLLASFAFSRQVTAQVIAEGVETRQMLNFLLALDTDPNVPAVAGFQGYLLGRPGPLPASPTATAGPERGSDLPLPRAHFGGPQAAASSGPRLTPRVVPF